MITAGICIVVALVVMTAFTLIERAKNDEAVDARKNISFFIKKSNKKEPVGKSHKETGEENGTLINYSKYIMTGKERLKYIVFAAAVMAAVGYIFFQSIVLAVILMTFSLFYPGLKRQQLIKNRKAILNVQFKDALHSISSSLSAGRAVEGSFKAAMGDLKVLYPDPDDYIIKEFEYINRKIEMNETIDNALMDFAKRADVEDITNFVDVFTICKSTGGNLNEVIKNTSHIINQKIEIKNEIEVLVAEQKFSQKILNIMPFGLIMMISASSPDYIQPLYSPAGHVVMFIVLVLLIAAYFIGAKIIDIKV